MNLQVLDDEERVAAAAAEIVVELLAKNPAAVLALPTGRTPLPLYRELIRRHRALGADFGKLRTFNLDEFVGVDPQHPGSFRAFMERNLFTQLNVRPRNIEFLRGNVADLEGECERYERAILAAGGLDAAILGIGANGHIAFNEPGEALIARTHVAHLTRQTREASAALFGGKVAAVPTRALTLGMRTILLARRIILIACGERKAGAIAAMHRGPVTPRWPASFLQLHADVTVLADPAAARRLSAHH